MASTWSDALERLLAALAVGVPLLAAGGLVDRAFPARRDHASTFAFNLLYYVPASALQAVLAPAAAAVTALTVRSLGGGLITLGGAGAGPWGLAVGFVAWFLAMDLGEYLFHRAQHRIPALWAMHSLHHSDEAFNVSTAIRHFWPETVIKSLTIWLAVALLFRADARIIGLYTVVGAWNYVTHMNVRLGFGRFAFLLNTPHYHRIHHSSRPQDRDCNFAALLPLFDVITGAYRPPARDDYPPTGLGDAPGPASLAEALAWPWRRCGVAAALAGRSETATSASPHAS